MKISRSDMQNQVPHFTYSPPNVSNGYAAWINKNGQPFHQIQNLDTFYKELGYTPDIRKAGVLPDEFIWIEYTKGNPSPYVSCLQMHFIEYLAKNSIAFISEYGNQYQDWFDNHIGAVTEGNISCAPCRGELFCQIGMSSSKIPEHLSTWLGGITNGDQ